MKKALSIILCLSMLVTAIPANVFAMPMTAVGEDTAAESNAAEGTLFEDTCTVFYNKGTGADVTGMPADAENVTVNTSFTVSDIKPKRDGYTFEGWATDPRSSETVKSFRVTGDTMLYAKWSKGGYMVEFDNPGDTLTVNPEGTKSSVTLAQGGVVDSNDSVNMALDLVKGEYKHTTKRISYPDGGLDFYVKLELPKSVMIPANEVDYVTIGARTNVNDADAKVYSTLFFVTKDENGNNIGSYHPDKTIQNVVHTFTGNEKDVVVTPYYVKDHAEWKGYISGLRFNYFGTMAAYEGYDAYIDFIKIPGKPVVEYLDVTMPAPESSAVYYDADVVTAGDGLEIVDLKWTGAPFIDGKYFNDDTAYTAQITVKALDGKAILSNAPAFATVNGEEATVAANGDTATITYTFAKTQKLNEFSLAIKTADGSAFEINEPYGQLQLVPAFGIPGGGKPVTNEAVVWTLGDEAFNKATITQDGLLKAINNIDALTVKVTSVYDPEISATVLVKITNQTPESTITFNASTTETVKNLQKPVLTKGTYTLPKDTGSMIRTSYALKGWSKTPGGEIVETDEVYEDKTYYAVWGTAKANEFRKNEAFLPEASEGTFTVASTGYVSENTETAYETKLTYAVIQPTNVDASKGVIFHGAKTGLMDGSTTIVAANKGIFSGSDRYAAKTTDYLEIRTTLSPENLELTVGLATAKEDGTSKTNMEYVTYYSNAAEIAAKPELDINNIVAFDGEYYSYKIPNRAFANWENYFEEIKISFVRRDATTPADVKTYLDFEDSFKMDFIRFVGFDIPAVYVEVDTPVAKGTGSNTGTSLQKNAYTVTNVTWSPELAKGKYFNGNTVYTATITVEADDAYLQFPRELALAEINGNVVTDSFKRLTGNRTATISYTFPATEDIGSIEFAAVTLKGAGADETEDAIVGEEIELVSRHANAAPAGYRWIGWSATEGGEAIKENPVITGDATYYAVYEFIDEIDFSNDKHETNTVSVVGGTVDFDGKWATITADNKNTSAKLVVTGFDIKEADYDFVDIIVNKSYEETGYKNKFGNDLLPKLTVSDGLSEIVLDVYAVEETVANNDVSCKYRYSLVTKDRTSKVTSISFAPYEGYPAWQVAKVAFIENRVVSDDIEITDIEEPKTWNLPDEKAKITSGYTVEKLEWFVDEDETTADFTADGSFDGNKEYKVRLTISTRPGLKIGTTKVTIDEKTPDSVVANENGTLTVVMAYPVTSPLTSFTMKLDDAKIEAAEGKVKLTPSFSTNIPMKDVVWEIVDNGPDGDSAVISADGTVKAQYNGNVVVKATSVYDPTVIATATVTITNQPETFDVYFYTNTTSEVTGMPGTYNQAAGVSRVQTKYDYLLPATGPTRDDGAVFAGWVTNPSDKITTTKTYVNSNKVFYALWVKGLSYEFNDNKMPEINKHVDVSNYGINTDEGTFSFEHVGNDPYIKMDFSNGSYKISDYPVFEIRVKNSRNFTAYSVTFYLSATTADGTATPNAGTDPSVEYKMTSVPFSTEYTTLSFDMTSAFSKWKDAYLKDLRIDLPDSPSIEGDITTIDYIRVVNYETSTVNITGVDVPVVKNPIDTTAVSGDSSKYEVTNVRWEGAPLVENEFFGGNSKYTVVVTVNGVNGYYIPGKPKTATINGNAATVTPVPGSTAVELRYEFPMTDALDASATTSLVSFNYKNEDGSAAVETKKMFDGAVYDIGGHRPASTPLGYRFEGWINDATGKFETGSITVNGNVSYNANFVKITELDMGNRYHTEGMYHYNARVGKLIDGMAYIEAGTNDYLAYIQTPKLNIDGSKVSKVVVYYDATIDEARDLEYTNYISAYAIPAIMGFSTKDAPATYLDTGFALKSNSKLFEDKNGLLVDVKRIDEGDGYVYYAYTYDMSKLTDWRTNYIHSIQITPYKGYPAWAVKKVEFIENTNSNVAEFNVPAPKTWEIPLTDAAGVKTTSNIIVNSISWTPARLATAFDPSEAYTVSINFRAAGGYTLATQPGVDENGNPAEVARATVNGNPVEAIQNSDGTFTAKYTFPKTENLKNVSVAISGKSVIKEMGVYADYKATVTANDGSAIPETGVVWSIKNQELHDNNGNVVEYNVINPSANSIDDIVLAIISQDGRLTAKANGVVKLIATSVYDNTKKAEMLVTLSAQRDVFIVTFDKNTEEEVTGLPAPIAINGSYTPERYDIKRDGFFFLGWSTDEDALDPTESYVITEDTTLYAKWGAGYEWPCNDAASSLSPASQKIITIDSANGYAIYSKATPDANEVVASKQGLAALKLLTSEHTELQIRASLPASGQGVVYVQSSKDETSKTLSLWDESAKTFINGLSANKEGEFQTITFDLSNMGVWNQYQYVEQVRFDSRTIDAGPIVFDWVRLTKKNRVLTFDADGGLIPLEDGSVYKFKQDVNLGTVTLPADPVKDGFEFVGWAKSKENYRKIYNGTFPVTDTTTLYAIWAPAAKLDSSAVTGVDAGTVVANADGSITITAQATVSPVINIADSMDVGENKTLIIMTSGTYTSASDKLVLTFKDSTGTDRSIDIYGAEFSGESTFVFDIANSNDPDAAYFDDNVTDVKVQIADGTADSGFTVNKIMFAAQSQVNTILGISNKAPVYVDVETVTGSGFKHPGHGKYEYYDDTQLPNEGVSGKLTETDSRTGTTPARPSEIVMGGEVKDPGNEKFPFTQSYDNRFKDVTYSDWFYDSVVKSFDLGFMNGKANGFFDAKGTVTVAEAITVAARINAIYNKAEIPAGKAGEPWYMPYVTYAQKKVLITKDQFADYNAPITREQVATLFSRVVPATWLKAINKFTSIPDMGENASVLRLYNAGVIVGVDDEHNFNPKANLTRAEFSAIINRVALVNSRIKVELAEPEPEETPAEDEKAAEEQGEADAAEGAEVAEEAKTDAEGEANADDEAKAETESDEK